MRKIANLFFFLCLISHNQAKASFEINEKCKTALRYCFEFRLTEAQKLVDEENLENPKNAYTAYISNYINCINLSLDENIEDYKKLKKNKKKYLSIIEEACPKSTPYYRFLQAEISIQWAFTGLKFADYASAVLDINKAYTLLEANEKLFPNFYLNKKSMGLLHALIGTVPDEYKWAVSILGFEGTIKQGVSELKTVYQDCKTDSVNNVYITEILLYRTFIEGNLLNNKADLQLILNELNNIEKTPIIVFCEASLHIKNGNNDAAIKCIQNTNFKNNQKHFYYLDYVLGDCKLKRLDKDANKYLLRYINNFKGVNYIKAANLRLWWYSLLFQKNDDCDLFLKNIELKGNTLTDEDKQALNETKQATLPNISLLKGRILFDGGYYNKALEQLQLVTKVELIQKNTYIEYVYRIARILDKQEKKEKAKQFYELTLQKGQSEPLYFAASAALHLGNLYESEGNNTKALFYYKKCQSLKNHAYKNSLSQKAKAGINRINSQ